MSKVMGYPIIDGSPQKLPSLIRAPSQWRLSDSFWTAVRPKLWRKTRPVTPEPQESQTVKGVKDERGEPLGLFEN